MANIDYEIAKKEIIKKFEEHDNRVIIFWYDESKSFYDDIKNDSFDGIKKIIYNNNEFAIKHLLEVEDLESNYLLYFPCPRPQDNENWLLDILLYSEEYYADRKSVV